MTGDQWFSLTKTVIILGFVLLVLLILARNARHKNELQQRRPEPPNEQTPQRDKREDDWTP